MNLRLEELAEKLQQAGVPAYCDFDQMDESIFSTLKAKRGNIDCHYQAQIYDLLGEEKYYLRIWAKIGHGDMFLLLSQKIDYSGGQQRIVTILDRYHKGLPYVHENPKNPIETPIANPPELRFGIKRLADWKVGHTYWSIYVPENNVMQPIGDINVHGELYPWLFSSEDEAKDWVDYEMDKNPDWLMKIVEGVWNGRKFIPIIVPETPIANPPELRFGQEENVKHYWIIAWSDQDTVYWYFQATYKWTTLVVEAKRFDSKAEAQDKAREIGYADYAGTKIMHLKKYYDSTSMGYRVKLVDDDDEGNRQFSLETPIANPPELRFGQLQDGDRLWLKAKDELKTFDDAQLKGRPNLMAELETAEAVYDSASNSLTITSSPTRGVIGLTLPMPRVVELFTIIPPQGEPNAKPDRDLLKQTGLDSRNFVEPKIYPEPYQNTLDYITPTSMQTGYRAGQVTQADWASTQNAPEVGRTTDGHKFDGSILTLKEELADDNPERVTRELKKFLEKNGFSITKIWWERANSEGQDNPYDVSEADNPRLAEIEVSWPKFQKDIDYRRAVFDCWSFLLGQGRYPYFIPK